MELRFNVTGADRKRLVGAVTEALQTPQKYLGVPSCAYQIGDYTVDKSGTLTGPDNAELREELRRRGFAAETFRNLADILTADDTAEEGTLSVEIPAGDFPQSALDNLARIIAAKSTLIQAALGQEMTLFRLPNGKLRFVFPYTADPDEVGAYARFVSLLMDAAKAKKRVIGKDGLSDNPRFQMRTWLNQLGAIGPEYRALRHIMTAALPGNGAFRHGRPESK